MHDSPLIAVTGGTGFIGPHLIRRLLAAGLRVRALYRRPESLPTQNDDRIEWLRGDMASGASWDALLAGTEAVAHLGAGGVASLRDPVAALEQNLPAYGLMLSAAARHRVRRLVVAGSCFEYGSSGERIIERGLREEDPLCPMNAYAASKAAGSIILGPLTRDLGLECFILRPFHTYGDGEPTSRLLPFVVESAIAKRPAPTTDGRQVRDLVHVSDVAAAFVCAITTKWPKEGSGAIPLNIGTGIPTRLREVVETIFELSGSSLDLIQFGAVAHRPNEMWRLVADPSAAATILGWTPTVTWKSGIGEMVARAKRLSLGRDCIVEPKGSR